MKAFVVGAFAAIFSLFAITATAQDNLRLRDAPPGVRASITQALTARGLQADGNMTVGINTSNCPSDCNDKVAGGFCLCTIIAGSSCPGDSTKVPGENTCRVAPTSFQSSGPNAGGGVERIQLR